MLCAVWPTTTQAQTQISAPVSVPSATTKNKVRVIITLKNRLGFIREGMHGREISSRQIQVARNVQAYVQNNKSLLKVVHRELTIVPMVVATVASVDLAQLAQSPQVASINEDKLSSPDLAESTDLIDSRAVNEGGYGGSGQMVAVLDTGIDKNHEFLSGQVYGEACFSTNDTDFNADSLCPNDTEYETGPGKANPCAILCDHGTHVAGIVAGKRICIDCGTANQVMMSGVAPDAKIMAVQVFSQFSDNASANPCADAGQSSPCVLSFDSDQIAALQWLVAFKPVWQSNLVSVNMSLGGGRTNASCDVTNAAHAAAINQLRVLGVATVIASGNSSFSNGIGYPACVSTAITVGSTRTLSKC
jgi:subtilisin family serine protease